MITANLIEAIEAALAWPESARYCVSHDDATAALRRIRKAIDAWKHASARSAASEVFTEEASTP